MPVIETQGNGQPAFPSGLYRNKETGQELIAQGSSKFGNPQADAFVRLGFEYVGPAPKNTEFAPDPNTGPAAANTTTGNPLATAAELRSQLAEAEAREAEYADVRKESEKSDVKADKSSEKGSK